MKKHSFSAHCQIEEDLRQRVSRGDWAIGSMLPSRHSLALEYGVSVSTVQQAMAGLVEEGTLRSEASRGTFVSRGAVITAPAEPQFSDFGAAQPVSALPNLHRLSIGKLGIVGDYRLDPGNWNVAVIQSLEQAFSTAGGQVICFNAWGRQSSSDAMADGATELLSQGVDALAFVHLYRADDLIDEVVNIIEIDRIPTVLVCSSYIESPVPACVL